VSRQGGRHSISMEVYSVLPAGPDIILQLKKEEAVFTARLMGESSFEVGETVYLQFSTDSILFYLEETGALVHSREEDGERDK